MLNLKKMYFKKMRLHFRWLHATYHYQAGTISLHCLKKQLLNLLLDGVDLGLDLRTLVLGNTGTNDWPGDATGTAQSLLGADKHVGDVLVLAQQRNVQQNLQGLAVCGQHNELSLSTVQGLGGLVGSLSDLLVVAGLLNQVQNLGGQCL